MSSSEQSKNDETISVDESLYSRQLYVMGHEAQKKMSVADVLIVGLNGLGVETAKNVILAGVRSVTLYDPKLVSYEDLSSQFFLSESDVGVKSRAESSVGKLSELNPYVTVSLHVDPLDETGVSRYTCVVLIDSDIDTALSIGDLCHSRGIAFITGDTRGVFGSIFCDFGEVFSVSDMDGEPLISTMLASITNDSPATVAVLEETRHNLQSGDYVVLTEIVGMEELNGREFRVTVKDPYSFIIDTDTTSLGTYQRGGYANQVKKPTVLKFEPISKSILNPGCFVGDVCKFDRAGPLHLAFRALDQFRKENARFPNPGDTSDADTLFEIAKRMNSSTAADEFKVDGIDEYRDLIQRFSLCCRGQLGPVSALLGGILGQEVLKACSGKFTPIQQWFYYDCLEALPDTMLPMEEVAPLGSRYDGQIMVFGKTLQDKILDMNAFLVGAGAIGCEMMKNFAMMGIASGAKGMVHITDMDQIERSNLSRQFLFRNADIGSAKSTTAARAVKAMNPSFKAQAYESKVATETEDFFNDDFFESLDFVCTALDNVEARLYVDQRCMFFHLPMLESGTLGTKGNTQVVVPRLTENYGASRDPPEQSIPVCTLKNFPNQIEHTLQWSRDWFEGVFKQTPSDCNQYLSTTTFRDHLASQQNMKLDTIKRVQEALIEKKPNSLQDCIVWARLEFEDMFVNKIKQLLHSFPADKLNSNGSLFWSGAKKPPSVVPFDPNDPLHMEFLKSTANLRASCYGLPTTWEDEPYQAVLASLDVPVFTPSDGVKIATTDEEAKAQEAAKSTSGSADIDQECEMMLRGIEAAIGPNGSNTLPLLAVVDFDKDCDDHMRVVAACSNVRARNYKIPEADLHRSRGIAGKIIPAIATTTALVTGAVCMELFKIIQGKPIEKLASMSTNLAISFSAFTEPVPPKVTTSVVNGKEWKFTPWDRIDIRDPDITLSGFRDYLEETYGVSMSMLSSGVSILFSEFMNKKKLEERMGMRIVDVVQSVTKKSINPGQKYIVLELIVNDVETDEEVEIPYVRFRLA